MRTTLAFAMGLFLAAPVLPAAPAAAHPGGTNAEGCHNNRKTGGYHCHGKKKAPPKPAQSRGGSVYYANCDAVRAAGKAPLKRGDPGYRSGLDRDNDGYACEYSRFNPR